jgi:hypothetical protein
LLPQHDILPEQQGDRRDWEREKRVHWVKSGPLEMTFYKTKADSTSIIQAGLIIAGTPTIAGNTSPPVGIRHRLSLGWHMSCYGDRKSGNKITVAFVCQEERKRNI